MGAAPAWGWDRPGLLPSLGGPHDPCPHPQAAAGLAAPWHSDPCSVLVLWLCVCSECECLHSLIASTNRPNIVRFTFNDQSYFECNLIDKIFNFCLLALDERQTVYVDLKLLAINF